MARPTCACPRPDRRRLLAALAWPACSPWPAALAQPAARAAGEVLIGGTGAALGVATRLLAGVGAVRVLPSLGTGGGLKALAAGAIDIALAARPLSDAERVAGLVAREWFRTPLVWATHPALAVSALGIDELLALYSGRTSRWPGGEAVRVVLRPENDADTQLMRSLGPAAAEALKAAHARPGLMVAATDAEAVEAIARQPGAIGTTSWCMVHIDAPALKVLDVGGVRPSLENMAAGRWPLAKRVHLVTRGAPAEPVRAVLDKLAGRAAAPGLAAAGCELLSPR